MYNEETYMNDIMSLDINNLLKSADYDFKMSSINFEPFVYDLLGGKIAYKYCDSTLINKLYEANVIDEYHLGKNQNNHLIKKKKYCIIYVKVNKIKTINFYIKLRPIPM